MSQIFAAKTNRAFIQTVFMGFVALAALFYASLKAYQLSSLYLAVLIHKIKDACGCENMAQFFSMHPDIFRAVILFGAGIGIFIFYSLYKLVKLILRTKKYTEYYLSFMRARQSAKLRSAIRSLGLDEAGVIEINRSDLAVFCFGYLEPKICISHALVDRLDKNELKSVLVHEAQHSAAYEPLKLFFVKYLRSIFFFLPGLKSSAKKYIILSELAADEKASGNSAELSSLAGAILKISDYEENLRLKSGSSLSFFSPAIEERSSRLSDDAYTPKFKFLDKSLIVGSLGLAVFSLIFIFVFSSSTKAFEMHNIARCVASANSQSDLACAALQKDRNIFGSNSNYFQNINSANLDQHSTCKAE